MFPAQVPCSKASQVSLLEIQPSCTCQLIIARRHFSNWIQNQPKTQGLYKSNKLTDLWKHTLTIPALDRKKSLRVNLVPYRAQLFTPPNCRMSSYICILYKMKISGLTHKGLFRPDYVYVYVRTKCTQKLFWASKKRINNGHIYIIKYELIW